VNGLSLRVPNVANGAMSAGLAYATPCLITTSDCIHRQII